VYLQKAKEYIKQYPTESNKFSGCSIDRIEHLKNYLNVELPKAFTEYLNWFGNSGGRTMAGSHFGYRFISDEYFNEMIEEEIINPGTSMKTWAEDLLVKTGFDPIQLLKNAIVFMYHPEGTFHYINTNEGENPPVYVYSKHESFSTIGPVVLCESFGEYILNILKSNIEGQMKLGIIK
jgi:hypothetical protein